MVSATGVRQPQAILQVIQDYLEEWGRRDRELEKNINLLTSQEQESARRLSAAATQAEDLKLAGRKDVQKAEVETEKVRAKLRATAEAGRISASDARDAGEKVRKLKDELSDREHELRKALAWIRELEAQPQMSAADTAETAALRDNLRVVQEEADAADRSRREAEARVQALERFDNELKKTNEYWLKQSQSLIGMLRPSGPSGGSFPPAYGAPTPSMYANPYMVPGL